MTNFQILRLAIPRRSPSLLKLGFLRFEVKIGSGREEEMKFAENLMLRTLEDLESTCMR